MIDTHCHLLPGLDDGPATLPGSLDLARALVADGVEHVVCTPHFSRRHLTDVETGLEGLRTYLREKRQQEFIDNLCRKLLSYGLGRTLLPSDDKLLSSMREKLAQEDFRFGVLVEMIVASPQFLTKRGTGSAQTE